MATIADELTARWPNELVALLREIGEWGGAKGQGVYLVGGGVRDALLGVPNYDLDLVVEGPAVPFARELARVKGWRVRTHPRFGTAKLFREGFCLDIVTARSETYEHPAALPTVRAGTIYDDLARRDFTINAMAARLDVRAFGELLDPHGGRADLEGKLIRVLHPASFRDDPTRMLRAIRYEQRLGFRLEPDTEALLREHLGGLDLVTGERLWHEMDLVLQEGFPEKVFQRAHALGVLRRLHEPLALDDWLAERFVRARDPADRSLSMRAVYLALLLWSFDETQSEGCIRRLRMPGWASRTIRDTIRLKKRLAFLEEPDLPPSGVCDRLNGISPEAVGAAAAAVDSPQMRQRLERYLTEWRHISPLLTGDDLIRMGIEPGRKIGAILRALRRARLDGRISSRDQEIALAREMASLP